MRALRITSAILVVLAVTLFAGAWLLPPLLDWNRFRTVLADLASTRLGRTVVIKGPVTLTLLPQHFCSCRREQTRGQFSPIAASRLSGNTIRSPKRMNTRRMEAWCCSWSEPCWLDTVAIRVQMSVR